MPPPLTDDSPSKQSLSELIDLCRAEVVELQNKLELDLGRDRVLNAFANDDLELFLFRYLKTKDMNIKEAFKVMRKSVLWREEWSPSEVVDLEDPRNAEVHPHSSIVRKLVPFSIFQRHDKEGNPLFMQFISRVAVQELLEKVSIQMYCEFMAYFAIQTIRHLNKLSREQNRLVVLTAIVDLADLNSSHYPFLRYFKYNADWIQLNCPELISASYVVNPPWFFNIAWKIIKPWLTKSSLQKVKIQSGKKGIHALKDIIDENQLPSLLGGTDTSELIKLPDPTFGMETIEIRCGKQFKVSKKADRAGMAISWRYKVLSKDISYSVLFHPSSDQEDVVQVHTPRRVSAAGVQEFCFQSPGPGELVIVFDNSSAFWSSKQILLHVHDFEYIEQIHFQADA